jgi:hypothetical protein
MKKIVPIIALSACSLMAIEPYNAFYINGAIGTNFNDSISTQTSTLTYEKPTDYSGAIGYQFKNYRVEFEYISTQADLYSVEEVKASGDFKKDTQLLNAYYCAYNYSQMVLNLGAGVGVSTTKLSNMLQNNTSVSDIKDSNAIATDAIVSLGYFISTRVSFNIKYRFLYTFEGDNFNSDSQNSTSFGVRVDF